jgi:hypothetical protein
MQGLPYTPIDPHWLTESSAFLSDDPKLVRASVRLLNAAWRGEPAGSVPADMLRLGEVCGLSAVEVGEHYEELTEGFELRNGRMHHVKMSALCARIGEKFGDVIAKLADQAAAVVQAPEEFELTAPVVEARTKGRRQIPAGFGRTPDRDKFMASKGFASDEDKDFMMEKFVLHCKSNNEMFNDWDSAFKKFAMKEDLRNIPSRKNQVPLVNHSSSFSSRAARFGGRGDEAVDVNERRMTEARTRQQRGAT